MSDKEQVKKISVAEHIRLRPIMYIGSVDKAGMHYIIIEFISSLCKHNKQKTEILLDVSNETTVLKFRGTIINQMVSSNPETTLKAFTAIEQNRLGTLDFFIITVLIHLASYIRVNTDEGDLMVLKDGTFDYSTTKMRKEDWLNFHFKLDEEFFGNHTFSKGILSTEFEKIAALNDNVHIELLDNRNGCHYQEKFIMEGGLVQLFNNKLDRLDSNSYGSYSKNSPSPKFHININEPELSLELVFMISNEEGTFEHSYYELLNLTNGGSHISYFKMRLEQLNEKLNVEFDSYDNDLNSYNLMTNIKAKHDFPFAGPTKTRIEDPKLVKIMKSVFDKLEPEITSFYSTKYSN